MVRKSSEEEPVMTVWAAKGFCLGWGKMVFPGPFREALSAGPNLSFSSGVALPHLNRLPALGMNSTEKLNGFGTVIGSETLSLLL